MIKYIIIFLFAFGFLLFTILFLYSYGRKLAFIRNSYQYFPQNLRNDVNRLARNILKSSDIIYLFKNTPKTDIQVFKLIIKSKDLVKINSNLPTAWSQTERLTGKYRKYVPATLLIEGKEYKVKIRYRGWTPEHWSEEKKSLQIKFIEPGFYEGKSTLKLILPEDRFFFVEALSNFIAKKLDLVSLDDGFINLLINNQDFGIYYIVEDFGKKPLERIGLNGETEFFSEVTQLPESPVASVFESIEYWRKEVTDETLPADDFSFLNKLLEVVRNGSHEEFLEIIDREYFLRWQVHSLLLGSTHQDYTHNNRLFWDKDLKKFKIIPWDNSSEIDRDRLDVNYNPLVNKIFEDPFLIQERNKILWQYLRENSDEDIEFLSDHYEKYRYWFYKDRKKIYPNSEFDQQTEKLKESLDKRYENLITMLKKLEPEIKVQKDENRLEIIIRNKDRVGLFIESIILPIDCWQIYEDFEKESRGGNKCCLEIEKVLVPYFEIPKGSEKFREEYLVVPQEFILEIFLDQNSDTSDLDIKKIDFNLQNQITGDKITNLKYEE